MALGTGPSRFLPAPFDALSQALWDVSSFHGRRLGRTLPLRLVQTATWAAENIQRPRLARYRSETPDGLCLEYVGHDPVLREKLLAALGGGDVMGVRAADVSAVEIPIVRARAMARAGALVLPRWVELEVDLRTPEETLWGPRRRESIRRVERAGYELEVATGDDAARFFYTRMFVPTALSRHGPSAVVRRFTYVREAARYGRLLFVRDGERRLAALLLLPRAGASDAWDAWLYGVEGGNYAASTVAREASYLFAIRWARDVAGATRLGLTTAPPFFSDGLVRYKMSWGGTLSAGVRNGTAVALMVHRASEGLLHALERARPFCLRFGDDGPKLAVLQLNAPGAKDGIDVRCADFAELPRVLRCAASDLAT